MEKIYLTIVLLVTTIFFIQAQTPSCLRMYKEATAFAKKGDYQKALDKYNAARVCDQSLVTKVDKGIINLFNLIEGEKEEAIRQRKIATDQTLVAEQQTQIAKEQKTIAQIKEKEAIEEKIKVEEALKDANANRLSTLALSVVEKDPLTALRIAEKAYDINYPQVSTNVSNTLSNIAYKCLDNKVLSTFNILLDTIKLGEAFLIGNNNTIVFNTRSGYPGTYMLDYTNEEVKKLSESNLIATRGIKSDIFLLHDKFYEDDNYKIQIWGNNGKYVNEIFYTDSLDIENAYVLPITNDIIVENEKGIIIYNKKGKEIKDISETYGVKVTLGHHKYKWFTSDGKYFFTSGSGKIQQWNHEGVIIEEFSINEDDNEIGFRGMSPDENFLLCNIQNYFYLIDINSGRKQFLDSVTVTDYLLNINFSLNGKKVIAKVNHSTRAKEGKQKIRQEVHIWDTNNSIKQKISIEDYQGLKFGLSPDNKFLFLSGYYANSHTDDHGKFNPFLQGKILIYDLKYSNRLIKVLPFPKDISAENILLPDNKIIYPDGGNSLILLDFIKNDLIAQLTHKSEILKFNVDHSMKIIISSDVRSTKIWSFGGELINELTNDMNSGSSELETSSNEILLYNSYDRKLIVGKFGKEMMPSFNVDSNLSLKSIVASQQNNAVFAVSNFGIKEIDSNGNVKSNEIYQDFQLKTGIAFSPDEKLYAKWDSKYLEVFNIKSGNKIQLDISIDHDTHKAIPIDNIYFSADNKYIFVYTIYGGVIVWKIKQMKSLQSHLYFNNLEGALVDSRNIPNRNTILVASTIDKLYIYNDFVKTDFPITVDALIRFNTKIDYSEKQNSIFVPSLSKGVCIYDFDGRPVRQSKTFSEDIVKIVYFEEKGTVICSSDNFVHIWDLSRDSYETISFEEYKGVTNYKVGVRDINISPKSEMLIVTTASHLNPITFWTLDKRKLGENNSHSQRIDKLVFSPDHEYFLTCTDGGREKQDDVLYTRDLGDTDPTAILWDKDGKIIHTIDFESGTVNNVLFSKDSKYMYIGNQDGRIKMLPLTNTIYEYLKYTNSTPALLTKEQLAEYGITEN